jgi:hypothetical protein
MHHGKIRGATLVGVGINITGAPMGCPPRMANPHTTLRHALGQLVFQISDFSYCFHDTDPALHLFQHGYAGRIIPSVFQFF